MAAALNELATSAGLLRQQVVGRFAGGQCPYPDSDTRYAGDFEERAGGDTELEKWNAALEHRSQKYQSSRERLAKDRQGRDRYLAVGVRNSVLAEYESVFSSLGWRCGMVLPRHFGEARWLTRNGKGSDSLLLTTHDEGFTAAVFRDQHPLIMRSVVCAPDEREDEFYRLLLFYRDRQTAESEDSSQERIAQLLVVGPGFNKQRASEIADETLGGHVHVLEAGRSLASQLPTSELSFDAIAAAAGLATMHWS